MSEEPKSTGPAWPGPLRSPRLRRWALGLGVAYALYAVLLGLVAPRLAREPIQELFGELLGIEVAIERITVNPFTLRIELTGIELTDTAGGPLVSARRLWANLELLKSVTGVLRLSEVGLESPRLDVVIDEQGELNLLALGLDGNPDDPDDPDDPNDPDEQGRSEAAEDATGDEGLFPVRVDELWLSSGDIEMRDRSLDHEFSASITPVDLLFHDFSTIPDEAGRVHLEAESGRGTHFTIELDTIVDPLSSRGNLVVEGIENTLLRDYLGPDFAVRPTAGELDLRADFHLELTESGLVLQVEHGGIEARGWEAESDLAEFSRVGLERFAIEGFRLALSDRRVGIGSIVLEGPYVDAIRPGPGPRAETQRAEADAAGDEIAEMAAEAASGEVADTTSASSGHPAGTPASEPPPEWRLDIDRFAVEHARVSLASAEARDTPMIQVAPIHVEAKGISSSVDEEIDLVISIALPERAPGEGPSGTGGADPAAPKPNLKIEGTVGARPPFAKLDVLLEDGALAPWSPLLGLTPGTHIDSGRLDLHARVDMAVPEAGGSATGTVESEVTVRDFALTQSPARGRGDPIRVVGFSRLGVSRLRVKDAGSAISVADIEVERPSMHLVRDARGELNLAGLMADSSAPPAPGAGAGSPAPDLDVRRVEIRDGRVDYRDESPARDVVLDLTEISGVFERTSGTGEGAGGGESGGAIDFSALVQGTTPLRVGGAFPEPGHTVVHVELEGLPVTSLAPYFEQFVGSKVEQGKLHLDLDYTLKASRLKGHNEVRFDRLDFGPRTGSKDALKLPVPLAFRLMTDTQGQAAFDLDIAGDLDDPGFSLRSLVTTAFVKVIQQSLSSPLAVLQTAMPDLTRDSRTRIAFAPGASELDDSQRETLVNVATLLANQPELRVGIKGRVDPKLDGRALRQAGRERDEDALRVLGQARARAVQDELVEVLGLEPGRIFIRSVDVEGKAADGRVPVDVVLTDD